jgi:large subunit ribosomal protein L4
MLEAPHYSAAGASKKSVSLPEALFDGTVNQDVLHSRGDHVPVEPAAGARATPRRAARSRAAIRSRGGRREPAAPARARPARRTGGTAASRTGPHPRSYRLAIPKKMRQLRQEVGAQRARARRALVIVDALEYEKPEDQGSGDLLGKVGGKETRRCSC